MEEYDPWVLSKLISRSKLGHLCCFQPSLGPSLEQDLDLISSANHLVLTGVSGVTEGR